MAHLIHVFETYYLFENKNKDQVKIFIHDDTLASDIQRIYRIAQEYVFKGIYSRITNQLVSKGVRYYGTDEETKQE